ncbi:hypothetical protein JW758_04210 [Candidatus Peregrinibacteria bacterium]|nr:hypothetical protein [Candidatus Peregrinibacteria bacterium]
MQLANRNNMTDEYKIALIIGVTEAIKQYGVPSQFCPTVAIIIGALIGFGESPNADGILKGMVYGTFATGGYAVVKRAGSGILSTTKKPDTTSSNTATPNLNNSNTTNTNNLEPDDYRGV